MGYYDPLVQIWPTIQGADTTAKLAALNAMTVANPSKQDVRVSLVRGKLMLALAWPKLKAYAAANTTTQTGQIAQTLIDLCSASDGSSFEMSNATTYAQVQQMLSLLAADSANTGITADLEAQLMALADLPGVAWWQANGYARAFDTGDITEAGLN